VITSVHTMVYTDDAEATRAFLRDVLGWPHVDAGDGWLIFRSGPSEMGAHPTVSEWEGKTWTHPRGWSVSLMCDDLAASSAIVAAKGAEFEGEVENEGYGLVAMMKVPGCDPIQLYQPHHPPAWNL
jgi:catechol 2,3-dioxygenase-like lactoylglutathione lyase family enzyme